jgi:hypothetical protein
MPRYTAANFRRYIGRTFTYFVKRNGWSEPIRFARDTKLVDVTTEHLYVKDRGGAEQVIPIGLIYDFRVRPVLKPKNPVTPEQIAEELIRRRMQWRNELKERESDRIKYDSLATVFFFLTFISFVLSFLSRSILAGIAGIVLLILWIASIAWWHDSKTRVDELQENLKKAGVKTPPPPPKIVSETPDIPDCPDCAEYREANLFVCVGCGKILQDATPIVQEPMK